MRKGKLGILLSYYAVLAFVLVVLNQTLLCGLLFLVALLFEKDEWLGRQTLQAFGLSLVVSLFSGISNVLSSIFSSWIFNFGGIFSIISTLVWVAAIILSIIAILNCLKEKDAGIPILSDIAYRAFGQQKPSYKPPVPPVYYQQQQQQNYQQQPAQRPVEPQSTSYSTGNPNIPPQQYHPQNQPPMEAQAANQEQNNDQTPPSNPTQI